MPQVGKWDKLGGIGSDAVKKKTGRGWAEWVAVLDKAGARAMDHKQIVQLLREKFGVGSWWQQMVTVGYEQARGKREAHQTLRGYQVGASKTVNVPIEELFAAWEDAGARARWLAGSPLIVRKATPNKSLRASWKDDGSSVDVNFYTKGERKSQISLQHTRLSGSGQVTRMQSFWRRALDQLKKMLEGRRHVGAMRASSRMGNANHSTERPCRGWATLCRGLDPWQLMHTRGSFSEGAQRTSVPL